MASEFMTQEAAIRVGFIGLGRMGVPMARQLVDHGFNLVVHNRTVERAESFASELGARSVPTARELAEQVSVVVTMVASGPALLELLGGDDGLCAGLNPGDLVIDMGTTGIEHTAVARTQLSQVGVVLVEAPVSGSVAAAESRALLVMVGGDMEAVAKARPVLDGITDRIMHVGGPGTGAAMKLVVNSVLFGINQAIAESLVLAERAGIDRSTAYDVFSSSAIAAPVVNYRRAVFEAPGSTPVTFSVDLAVKDLDLILELASSLGATMPQTETNARVMANTSADGFGQADMGDVAVHLRQKGTRHR